MTIGTDQPRKESWEKVTGTAKYNEDFIIPGILSAALVISPHSHARILGIDARQAAALPGVLAVVTGRDYPQLSGTVLFDRPAIAIDTVRYCGEPVAMVVADEEFTARKAARLVNVEYELLPSVTSPAQAIAPGAPILHENLAGYVKEVEDVYPEPGTNIVTRVRIRKGDPAESWHQCACIVEGHFTLPQSDHMAMEVRSARAEILPSGAVIIETSSQAPFAVKKLLARCYELEEGLVNVKVPFVGGGYGGKAPVQLELLAYIASRAAGGRKVRIAYGREEDIMTSPCKLGAEATLKIGVKADGAIMAAHMTYLMDTGAYADIGPRMATAIAVDCSGPYHIPNIHCDVLCVYTNHTYATSYRGFGHITSTFCMERMMDKIAQRLSMDPMAVREINALKPGHETPTRVKVTLSNAGNMSACIDRLKQVINWHEGPLVEAGEGKVRAKGLGSVFKTSDSPSDAVSGAIVTFNTDGSLNLNIGVVEIGPGMKTTAAQMLAEAMNMDIRRVHVNMDVDTQVTPKHWKTVASMTTFMIGRCVIRAAQDLQRQLFSLAATAMKCTPEDLALGRERVYLKDDPEIYIALKDLVHGFQYPNGTTVEGQIIGRGTYVMRHITRLDRETGKGKPGPYWTLGAQAVEVEYDRRDHTYRLLRAVTVLDAGKVINPKTARGVVMGAMCMGLSLGSREVFHENSEGGINNTSLRTYKVIHYGEEPIYTTEFIETPNLSGPFGARGLAEHGLIGMPAALCNALSRAAGVDIDRLPVTPELIWNLKGGAME